MKNMAGFFDFIKKPTQNASAGTVVPHVAPQPPQPPQSPQVQNINNIIASVNSSSPPPVKPVIAPPAPPNQPVKPPSPPPGIGTKPLTSNIDAQKRAALDLMTHLTQRSNRVFLSAQSKAKELEDEFIDSEHLLHGLLADGEIYKLLTELKLQPQLVEMEIAPLYKRGGNKLNPPQNSPRLFSYYLHSKPILFLIIY